MSSKYSCWPVVMVIYNLPPWLCMKRNFMMLSILISGPKQPGDDIGIYGVQCYDAYSEELFNLRTVLLWTINDFSAYGNLSGCSVKGYKACPICEDNTSSIRLKYGKKMAYLGHRKFLPHNHPFRRQKKSFNGQRELGSIPEPLFGEVIFEKTKDLDFQRGKINKKRKHSKGSTKSCWNRKSAFFELPYWKHLHQAKPRKSNKVDTTQQIIDENEALRKCIRELEQKVQSIPTSEHGSCSKSKVQEKIKCLFEVKEEEVIATTPMTKNEVNVKVKSSRPMTKEVELTSEPSNLPIQLKYILRYAERGMVDGSSFSFQLPLELFGISQKSYVLREDVIDFCNMQKVKTLSMVSKYVFVDPSLISAGHSTREIRARNLCSRLMTSKQDQLVVAPYNPGDHWALVIINPYDDVVYHLNSLRTSSRDNIKYVTNMALTIFQSQKNLKKTRKTTFRKAVKVGTVECGYYIMRYMREIMSKDTSIITDAIDTRNSYSQLELDEVRVEWAEFLSRYI
ncbi:hypothetical protein IC582_000908 [Cucumis melo]